MSIDADKKQFEDALARGVRKMGIDLTQEQMDLMAAHAGELISWNRKMNLTAIREPGQIAEKHFADAIAAARYLPEKGRFMDLGSGGGFPAIPLKIMHPGLSLTLVDAVRKKVTFLSHVIRTLKLDRTCALHSRIEDLAKDPDHAGTYDGVVARGFSDLSDLVRLALPMLAPGGSVYALKGENGPKEITPELEARFDIRNEFYQLPSHGAERYLIILKEK